MWVIPLANSIDFCRNFFCVVLKNTAKNRRSQISCMTGGCKFNRFIKRSLNQTLFSPLLFHSLKGWQVVTLLLPQQTTSTNDFPCPLFTSLPASRRRFVATDVTRLRWTSSDHSLDLTLDLSCQHEQITALSAIAGSPTGLPPLLSRGWVKCRTVISFRINPALHKQNVKLPEMGANNLDDRIRLKK